MAHAIQVTQVGNHKKGLKTVNNDNACQNVFLFFGATVPADVDKNAILQSVTRGVRASRRFEKIRARSSRPGNAWAIEILVKVMDHPIFGNGHTVSLQLLKPNGEVEEEYIESAIGEGDTLPSTAEHVAYGFADPEFYSELLQDKGFSGDHQHPRIMDLDPTFARTMAECACFNAEPAGLVKTAERYLRIAKHTSDPEYLLEACELFTLAGDIPRAREVLLHAPQDGTENGKFDQRLVGLDCLETLGHELVSRLLIEFGRSNEGQEDPRMVLNILVQLSRASGRDFIQSQANFERYLQDFEFIMNVISETFGSRIACLYFVGMTLEKVARRRTTMEAPYIWHIVTLTRPLLQRVTGQKNYWRLLELIQKPSARWANGARGLLNHITKCIYSTDANLQNVA